MGTEEIMFQGSCYCPSENKRRHICLHKVNATLNRWGSPEDNQDQFCLTVVGKDYKKKKVVFNSCELCYVEKDETEVKRRHRWSGINCFRDDWSIVRIFSMVSLVIKQQDKEDSITFRFLQDVDFSKHSDNGLDRLCKIMNNITGRVYYWFGDAVDDLNNFEHDKRNESVRLVATPRNVCLLNKNLEILRFNLVENKNIRVEYDEQTSVIQIIIEEMCECSTGIQNFVRIQTLKFCSIRGREIKQKLEDFWNRKPCYSTEHQSLELLPLDYRNENGVNLSNHSNDSSDCLFPRGTLINRATGLPAYPRPHSPNGQISYVSDDTSGMNIFPSLPSSESTNIDNDSAQTVLKQESDCNLPPPGPCNPPSQFVQASDIFKMSAPMYSPSNPKPIPKGVIRSHSCSDLKFLGIHDLEKQKPKNIYGEDYPYFYHFYNNYGFVRYKKASMSKRIKRRNRISSEIEDVDFTTVDRHEAWFDQSFRGRDSDDNYRRVNKIYTTVQEQQLAPNITKEETDDPYWNSDLCLTIQRVLENKKPDLCRIFDLPFPRMTGVIVHLDVEKTGRSNDWRDLAEMLGLDGQDIEIIQHFCYKYREWTTEIVLIHWVFQVQRGRRVLDCNYDTLRSYIEELQRDDVIHIMQSESNEDEGSWWEENTKF